MHTREELRLIIDTTNMLSEKYPMINAYNSKCTLWRQGLTDGVITTDLYVKAKDYYGVIWNYDGD